MNVKRFTARTSRDALHRVRPAFGSDAVVRSTRPCAEGVEVLGMGPEGLQQIEKAGAQAHTVRASRSEEPPAPAAAPSKSAAPRADAAVEQDVEQLAMSTLSFRAYVRERMPSRAPSAWTVSNAAAPQAAAP
jgi:flagellar biosynthesis protein FlhF